MNDRPIQLIYDRQCPFCDRYCRLVRIRKAVGELNERDYLLNFVLPNFYFHVTTAYDILRHNGVALGKRDFLGSI